jgi:hypothetical protein
MTCTTHHHACECREGKIEALGRAAMIASELVLEKHPVKWAPAHAAIVRGCQDLGITPLPLIDRCLSATAQGIDEEV